MEIKKEKLLGEMKSEKIPVEKKSMHTMLFLILDPNIGFAGYACTILGCARLVLEMLAKEEKSRKATRHCFVKFSITTGLVLMAILSV